MADRGNFKIISDAHRMMVDEMRKIRPQKSTNQGVMICCPFHSDKTPSLSVNLTHGKVTVGTWFCFGGCGGGPWNKLAKKLNLKQVDERTVHQMTEFHGRKAGSKLLSEEDERTKALRHWELDFVEPWPHSMKWRGFPGEFIAAMNGELSVDTKRKDEVLLLPVNIGQEEVGFVKALLKKQHKQLSYVNSPGEWSKNNGLYGYDMAAALIGANEIDTVFVAEGPRDALRLLYYGVPAVAVLGASMWSPAKRDLILSLGIDRVVLWMDSDEAGVKATNVIRKSFTGYLTVKFINGQRLLDVARKDYGHKGNKVDVANAPVELFKKTILRYVPEAKAKGYESAVPGRPQL